MTDDPFTQPIVYPVKDLRIEVNSDVIYKTVDDVQLAMDTYAPSDLSRIARLPLVLFVHGGPISGNLSPKDWGVFRSYGRLAAVEGFVGVTFNHRFFSIADRLSSVEDVNDAIRFIRDSGERFHVDPDRTCLWVFSGAGTLLGSVVAANHSHLIGWLAFYAPLHAGGEPMNSAATDLNSEGRLMATGAILELDETGEMPMFIARAGLDRPALNKTIDAFVQRALELNRPVTLINHPAGQHGFDILDDDPRSREIIQMAVAFVKEAARKSQNQAGSPP